MTFQTIKYRALALLAGAAMVCGGCHNSDDPCPPGPDSPITPVPEKLTLCLNVSFDGQEGQTRAGNEPDGYEGPIGDFEKIRTLRVIIVRNIFADRGEVEANRLVSTYDNGKPVRDNFEFEVIANEDKRIYLIANEGSLQSPSSEWETAGQFLSSYKVEEVCDLNLLASWTVSIPDIKTNAETNAEYVNEGLFSDSKSLVPTLPLTEFFDIYVKADEVNTEEDDNTETNPDDENSTQVTIQTCYTNLFITRTAAKATFYIDYSEASPAYDDVKVEAITLSGIGSEEYVFPHNTIYSKDKYWGENKLTSSMIDIVPKPEDLDRYITSFATPSGNKTLTYEILDKDNATGEYKKLDIDIVKNNTAVKESQIAGPIYFPESILGANKHYEVGVLLSTGVWLTAPLETNILNIEGHDAVARNTHLKITLKFTGKDLQAEVRVAPYIGVVLGPIFGNYDIIKPPKPRT